MLYCKRSVLLFFLVAVISGCASKTPESMLPKDLSDAANKEDKEMKLLNNRILTESFTSSVNEDYRIGPGDLLDIKVYEAADLSGEVRVSSRGTVTYPLLGEIELGGLTTRESEERLQELIGAKYVKDPHVSVFVKEYRSKQVAVVGAVNRPGNYELLGKGSILDALAMAGGLKEEAGKLLYLSRHGQNGQIEIDLDRLLVKGDTQLNLPVSMGDMIFVPEAGTFYVNGAVKKPGSFRLKDEITVSQAVQMAGGLETGARASDAKLLRFKDGQRQVMDIDLKAIERGEQKDIALQDQDVLYLSKNPIVALFQTLRVGFRFFPFFITGSAPE
ncbi:MAG TPA: SLBB domain-containing protein [Thermodesulfobacteriota bacterium]|nr:SLBB domain-containing protein [Thermodesulfobacteriota bacterium]